MKFGTGHTHRVDVVSGDQISPIRMGITEAERIDRSGQPIVRGVVGNRDQGRPERCLRVVLAQPRVRARMHLTHPAPAHDANRQDR
jgi:hypothetical protein